MTTTTPEAPPREAFELRETIAISENAVAEDGTVLLHLIRPCVGRGKGRHLYEADMLAENAHKFGGYAKPSGDESPAWKMFIDHQSDEARRAAGGLPRSLRDVGGRVIESWWDPSVPASGGFGQGAVVGRVRPTRLVRELIEDDPKLVEASINARATSVRPVIRDGRKAWLVEGIEDRGSVDWVTEGGAGGRVASLLEAVYHGGQNAEEKVLLDTMTDVELVEHLRDERPELLEALASAGGNGDEPAPTGDGGEALREALLSEEGQALLRDLVESLLTNERELIRAEARADADRQLQVRDLRDRAHEAIESAKLPAAWTDELKRRFEVGADGPSPALDVYPDVSDEGEIERAAEEKLDEAIEKEVAHTRELIAAANPTRVRHQGPTTPAPDDAPEGQEKPKTLWRSQLREAGFEDPDAAYEEEE